MSVPTSEKVPEHKILWIFVKVPKEKISTHPRTRKKKQMFSAWGHEWFLFPLLLIICMIKKNQEKKTFKEHPC